MDADFLLIKKMKRGDETALDLFVHKYYGEILKYCGYHCADRAYAEDLTQETFVHFFAKLSKYQYRGKTKNYLYTIAGNLCRDFYRKARELPAEEQALQENIEAEDCSMEYSILNKLMIESALGQLSDELREIVILYFFQELKLAEIADILGISLSLVKYRVRQSKILLKEVMRKEEQHDSRGTTYSI